MNRKLALLALLAAMCLTAGCWDYRRLTDITFALGMGLDLESDGKLLVTLQFPLPGIMKGGAGGGGGEQGNGAGAEGQGPQFFMVEGRGSTLPQALNDAQRRLSRPMSFGHLQVVLLGRTMAESDGFTLEELLRFAELDKMSHLMVVDGATAAEALRVVPQQERMPALYLTMLMDSLGRTRTQAEPSRLIDALVLGLENGRDLLVTVIKLEEGQHVVEGVGVFRHFHLVVTLGHEETRALLLTVGKTTNATMSFERDDGTRWSFRRIRTTNAKMSVTEGSRARLLVRLRIAAEVGGSEGGPLTISAAEMRAMEETLARLLRQEVEAVIRRLQQLEVDPLGFFAQQYGHLHDDERWRHTFREAALQVDVSVQLKRKGQVD